MQEQHPGAVRGLFDTLLRAYGPRHWWPARTVPEMMVGAMLVQNTTWTGASQAVARLEEAGLLDSWSKLLQTPDETLGALIRPAGYFRVKTRRLKALAGFMAGFDHDHTRLFQQETPPLRAALLGVHGVGKETADSILCYAAQRPIFVVDAYTRRIFSRLGWCDDQAGYDDLQRLVMSALPPDAHILGEMHALLVEHAKTHCRAQPRCAGCPVGPCLTIGLHNTPETSKETHTMLLCPTTHPTRQRNLA
ncbi:MAG: endonuclease [Magnetococcales bacterium]|nr:endonuclease [Magnetococcales bacterium]